MLLKAASAATLQGAGITTARSNQGAGFATARTTQGAGLATALIQRGGTLERPEAVSARLSSRSCRPASTHSLCDVGQKLASIPVEAGTVAANKRPTVANRNRAGIIIQVTESSKSICAANHVIVTSCVPAWPAPHASLYGLKLHIKCSNMMCLIRSRASMGGLAWAALIILAGSTYRWLDII